MNIKNIINIYNSNNCYNLSIYLKKDNNIRHEYILSIAFIYNTYNK